ncbi:D,D-heptose 1,7-bisphosphate phosphatase [Limihaloglobus sulfuriphilus]|uniref:D,D-heptose 1,7-bisphosphate phosphatase n=1 Tax=Limihaloglobus sulfuriphilus TaxID=1851148 RepID=A0A1Q2MF85_9BACT|nr:HAD-IIIA family hydrolase [Limihaloglobus sulfuriphilus]AQQ71314.1 D,D-heptose 1,7-bisphosphate phosphatase [Limihaloglobus sulfuriphilus]
MTETKSKAVFLDKYGTLIQDQSLGQAAEQIKLLPGAARAVYEMKQLGYKAFIASNEPAAAAGTISMDQLEELNAKLSEILAKQKAEPDGIYCCPFDPDAAVAEYAHKSRLRKPAPGMLLKAAQEHAIDLENSWMIGDSLDDIRAGIAAGCKTILIRPTARKTPPPPDGTAADYEAVNITEASNYIKMQNRKENIQQSLEFEDGSSESKEPGRPAETAAPALAAEKPADTEQAVKENEVIDAQVASNVGKCLEKMGNSSKGRDLLLKSSGLFASEEQRKLEEARRVKRDEQASETKPGPQTAADETPAQPQQQKPETPAAPPQPAPEAKQTRPAAQQPSEKHAQRDLPETPLEDANKKPAATKDKHENDAEIFQFIAGIFQAAAVLMGIVMIITIIMPNLTSFSAAGLLATAIVSQVLSIAFAKIKPSH